MKDQRIDFIIDMILRQCGPGNAVGLLCVCACVYDQMIIFEQNDI